MTRIAALLAMLACLPGCGSPIGHSCDFSGSGFTASDNCRYRCMQFREIVCPDGNTLKPRMCSGKPRCEPGTCPSGQVCYHVNDPYQKESYCLPADVCGQQSAVSLTAWEKASLARSQQTLAAGAARRALRSNSQSTAPAAQPLTKPAPQ